MDEYEKWCMENRKSENISYRKGNSECKDSNKSLQIYAEIVQWFCIGVMLFCVFF